MSPDRCQTLQEKCCRESARADLITQVGLCLLHTDSAKLLDEILVAQMPPGSALRMPFASAFQFLSNVVSECDAKIRYERYGDRTPVPISPESALDSCPDERRNLRADPPHPAGARPSLAAAGSSEPRL